MGFYSRNDRNVFAATAAEEERRRLDAEAASGLLREAEDAGHDRSRGDRRGSLAGRRVARIRHALGR